MHWFPALNSTLFEPFYSRFEKQMQRPINFFLFTRLNMDALQKILTALDKTQTYKNEFTLQNVLTSMTRFFV